MMDTSTTSIDNFGLHRYAIIGDDEGVRRSLRDGADINALDTAGRTALMCAVAGEKYASFFFPFISTLNEDLFQLAEYRRL